MDEKGALIFLVWWKQKQVALVNSEEFLSTWAQEAAVVVASSLI